MDIVIVGAGGFAREVYTWLRHGMPEGHRIKGFLAPNPHDLDGFGIEEPILGSEDDHEVREDERFLPALGHMAVRVKAIETLARRGARFLTYVHPTAIVAPTAELGQGVVVCPFSLISDSTRLGDFTIVNFYASVGHDASTGAYAVLSPYATINGRARLGARSFMGTHATIAPGVTVGARSKVAANSAVLRDARDDTLQVGVPSKSYGIFGR